MKKRLLILTALVMVFVLVLAACAPAAEEPAAEEPVAEVPVAEEPVVEEPMEEEPMEEPADPNELPRDETLYFNGQQWGSVVGWNPYASSNNNAMAVGQADSARVTMFETPYLFDMLDGQVYPLLADGDYTWNDAQTEITFKLKPAAMWSDGTPVTAEDVAYTWATHVKYNTGTGGANVDFIEDIVAVDPQTVVVKAKLDADGNAVNPLIVAAYVSSNYVLQKAWTETLEERSGGDATAFLADTAWNPNRSAMGGRDFRSNGKHGSRDGGTFLLNGESWWHTLARTG